MARDRALSTKRAAGFERARQLNAYTSAAMRFIFIRSADGDRRLLSGGGNRHCAEALRSAILSYSTDLLDIIRLYEGNPYVEDKT